MPRASNSGTQSRGHRLGSGSAIAVINRGPTFRPANNRGGRPCPPGPGSVGGRPCHGILCAGDFWTPGTAPQPSQELQVPRPPNGARSAWHAVRELPSGVLFHLAPGGWYADPLVNESTNGAIECPVESPGNRVPGPIDRKYQDDAFGHWASC